MPLSTALPRSPMAMLAVLGAVAVSTTLLTAALASGSTALAAAEVAGLAAGAYVAFTRQVRRPLIATLFFVAPLDLSKAVLVPTGSIFYASGPYYSPGLYLTLGDAVLLALALAWLAKRVVVERRRVPFTALDALAAAYGAWIWIRAFGAAQGALSLASAAAYSFAILAFYVASHTLRRPNDLRLALKSSALALACQLAFVAAQMVTGSPLSLPGSKGLAAGGTIELNGAQTMRPPGTFTHPNSLAHYLIVALAPLLALSLLGPKRLPVRVWAFCVALLAAGIAALLATLSRGGWTAFVLAAGMVILVYWRQGLIRHRQIAGGLAAVALGAALVVAVAPNVLLRLTASDGRSFESRTLLADLAVQIIEANPWTGVGFGDYNRSAFSHTAPSWALVSEDYHLALHQLVVHNHFLLVAAELGIPAMLLFVYLLWRFIRLPWPLAQWNDPARFALAIGLSAGMLGQALFLNSDNYYVDIRIFLLWLAAGMLQAITLQQARKVRERSA